MFDRSVSGRKPEASSQKAELLLFDLGGVLVDFSGTRDLARFMRAPSAPGEILRRWIECPHTTAYEGGKLPADEWAERFVRDWDLTVTPEEFLTAFAAWSRGFFPGAAELLADLRPRYRLAALSNSNQLHWKRNEELGILREFEFTIASHQVGCCKPDPAIFLASLDRACLSPDAVAFFDDQPANVAGAASCGIRAFRVEGVTGVRECLMREGLL
jgi:HAD superfamily hydrolase (TIGR01509 family)